MVYCLHDNRYCVQANNAAKEHLMMEWLTDPTIWAGLLTLVVLEIVLGIDNLVFIAILADKLPPEQREKARVIGLSLALVMRLALLSVISHLMRLTEPLISWWRFSLSGRDLILLAGGIFLLWKATTELHERLEGVEHSDTGRSGYASFGMVLLQIVVLDAVFSLDSIITAVGMVDHLPVMMAAVVIAMAVMMWGSKPLTAFVGAHPTVVVLCLSFLLMIGFSLLAEGLGFHLPKGYLYAAIGFSVLIEFFNQLRQRNLQKQESRLPRRERTARAVLRLLGEQSAPPPSSNTEAVDSNATAVAQALEPQTFGSAERHMVSSVLHLGQRNAESVMTPRHAIHWLDLDADPELLQTQLVQAEHGLMPVARGNLDQFVGVARTRELLADLLTQGHIDEANSLRPALVVPGSVGVLRLAEMLRQSRRQIALVSDEYGSILGLVTPIDLLEAIAGEFPDEDEVPEIQAQPGGGHWIVSGVADLFELERTTGVSLHEDGADYSTLAGLLMDHLGYLPSAGEVLELPGLRLQVLEVDGQRIASVDVRTVS